MKINRRMPSEWHKQSGVQLTWPHIRTDWSYIFEEAEECFINIATEISKRERLLIVTKEEKRIKKILEKSDLSNVVFADIASNDTWARDHGGITTFEGEKPLVLDFCFNGWGMKFGAYLDNQITTQLYHSSIFNENILLERHKGFVLEGGSIESDGCGTIMTTSECLLSKNRNEYMSKTEIEDLLKRVLGADRLLWIEHGYLSGDDTDSHVDTLVRFCSEDTITYVKCYDKDDEHYEELSKMEDELSKFTKIDGSSYSLVPLPMTKGMYFAGERLPSTYANFLIINDAVLVPTYNCDTDAEALSTMKSIFTDREIVGIDCSVLIKQHGSLHCVTMQYPEGVIK